MTWQPRKTTLLLITLILVFAVSCGPPKDAATTSPGGATEPTRERKATATPAAAAPAAETPASAPPAAGSLDLAEAVSVAAGTIGPDGGTIEVSSPGDPLDGLSIEVPPGAYAENVSFEITSREVRGHSLGQYFNPVSPLIEIRAGGTLANELLTMTIPIEIGADEFAMAFAYDAASGKAEGLALLESTDNSVKVATRDISRDVLVSAVLVDDLYGDTETGFVHGVDDWYFPNYGSFISPGGHCAGQSISAMYYFIDELGSQLYGKYDNYDNRYRDTPNLWTDDELGYRLASVTQESLDWDGSGRKFWSAFNRKYNDHVVYNAFAYSMLVTGLPQFVGIYGTDEDGKVFGHALIAYRIEDNKLYVSDPNFPAWTEGGKEERSITFDASTGEFEIYSSGATAGDTGDEYDRVLYFGYKDLIDWGLMGKLWDRLEEGSIGIEDFPRYELAVRQADSEVEDELWTNYESEGKDIVVRVRDTDFVPALEVLDATGKRIGVSTEPIAIELQDGDNWLGFVIRGAIKRGDRVWFRWVGFDWVKVIYEAPEKPDPTTVSSTVTPLSSTVTPLSSTVTPLRWVRAGSPVINAAGAPLEYYGGGSTPGYFGEARFEGKFVVYYVSETSFAIDDRNVDRGFEFYNVTIRSDFDAPPPVLTPGESHPLTVNFTHSGTVVQGSPGVRFWYSADADHTKSIQPPQPFPYWPWAETFSGETAWVWTLAVPQGRAGDTFQITAAWWNYPPCNVTWTYQME